MEGSMSSLKFRGSIHEAIVEAKVQKKLFVVYISGEDSESRQLESSTLVDPIVVESVSKYCVLLHITEGSADAANFFAIYSHKVVPSITVVGYNGIQLWQSEGSVNAETLASTFQKAWLGLHIQETLSASLTSMKPESSTSGSQCKERNSSDTDGLSCEAETCTQSLESEPNIASQSTHENWNSQLGVQDTEVGGVPSNLTHNDDVVSGLEKQSASPDKEAEDWESPVTVDADNSGVVYDSSTTGDGCSVPPSIVDTSVMDHHSEVSGTPNMFVDQPQKTLLDEEAEAGEDKGAEAPYSLMSRSVDVHLNIRLPNGSNLQEKFSTTSTLKMVKDYVDGNQTIIVDSYDLALPYPRKVFDNEALSRSLSELELVGRQALIVVPHKQPLGHHQRGGFSFPNQNSVTVDVDSSNESHGGYFAFIGTILSYLNPFSYLGGSSRESHLGEESQSRTWQYGPNTLPQNIRGQSERPYARRSPSEGTSSEGQKRPTASQFGSNIHTLKHDKDDPLFGDGNAFWNGNSTQYGGNNDGK